MVLTFALFSFRRLYERCVNCELLNHNLLIYFLCLDWCYRFHSLHAKRFLHSSAGFVLAVEWTNFPPFGEGVLWIYLDFQKIIWVNKFNRLSEKFSGQMFILTNKIEVTERNSMTSIIPTIFFHEKWLAHSFKCFVVFAYLEPVQKQYMIIDMFFVGSWEIWRFIIASNKIKRVKM